MALRCLLIYGFLLPTARAFSILLLSSDVASHVILMGRLGTQLLERGHDVTLAFSSSMRIPPELDPNLSIDTFRNHHPPFTEIDVVQQMNSDVIFHSSLPRLAKFLYYYPDYVLHSGHALLKDDAFISRMHNLSLDYVIVDAVTPSLTLYPYIKQIPFSVITHACSSWDRGILTNPSFIPHPLLGYSDSMTLYQRCVNTLVEILCGIGITLLSPEGENIPAHRPLAHYGSIFAQGDLCMTIRTNILDFNRPVTADIVSLAPVMARPGKTLSDNDKRFLDRSRNGTILVSFGSHAPAFPDYVMHRLLSAFAALPYDILLKYSSPLKSVPPNVVVRPWIAQNDLLGHPTIRLFVTHGGYNSLIETVFHGVPVVMCPLMIDQNGNAQVAKGKGIGEIIDIVTATTDEIIDTISKVIHDKSYKYNAKDLSNIFREIMRTNHQNPSKWIEHVIMHGSKHLKSRGTSLPWYQFLLLDVALVYISVLLTITIIVVTTFRIITEILCNGNRCIMSGVVCIFQVSYLKVQHCMKED